MFVQANPFHAMAFLEVVAQCPLSTQTTVTLRAYPIFKIHAFVSKPVFFAMRWEELTALICALERFWITRPNSLFAVTVIRIETSRTIWVYDVSALDPNST